MNSAQGMSSQPISKRKTRRLIHHLFQIRTWSFFSIGAIAIVLLSDSPSSLGAKGRRRNPMEYRTIDGTENAGPGTWGATHTELIRIAPPDYLGDGSGDEMMAPPVRPNARTISNLICAQEELLPNERELSDWLWAWGQFLDHDIDLTETHADNGTASIEIDDPFDILGPFPIPFTRSNYHINSGTTENPRQQINEITAFIDASNVYGSDEDRANALREFSRGRLKTSVGNLLPFNESGQPNAGGGSSTFFFAGDIRANENVVLSSLHTLFVREHNRIAHQIYTINPNASDEMIYQLARKIVGAEMQVITYAEFLPAFLGDEAPTLAECAYDPSVNPAIANEFSTALFRFGHSLLSPNLQLWEQGLPAGEVALRDAFFNPDYLVDDPTNVDRLLEGLAHQYCQNVDTLVVDDVRNFLFGPPGAGGFDLASLNIQRGRDHGLADYNYVRDCYGLPRYQDFAEITSDVALQDTLRLMYGTTDNIDTWVGGLAEDHLPGCSVGPLIATGLREQFCRLLAGDKYSFLNDPNLQNSTIKMVTDIQKVTLAKVVRRNTTIRDLPEDVFFVDSTQNCDMTARYNPRENRLYICGNHGNNNLTILQNSRGIRLLCQTGSRINGRQALYIRTKKAPHLTIDLGPGTDRLSIGNGKWGKLLTTFGTENDRFVLGRTTRMSKLYTDLRPIRPAPRRR